MKRLSFVIMVILLAALPVCFTACNKDAASSDNCRQKRTYTYYEPIYKTRDQVRENIKSNGPRPIERPGKIYIFGKYIFLNEIDKGIHVIDNANPSNPKNLSFIDIPGNLDIAATGNFLYADMYTDLIAIDISYPLNIKVTKIVDNLFPHRAYGNSFNADITGTQNNMMIAGWEEKKVTITEDCNSPRLFALDNRSGFFSAAASNSSFSTSPVGIGGSMARFAIMDKRLYTVSMNDLGVYSIQNSADPKLNKKISLGWNIETIYPFRDKLFIGSQTGMMIYDVQNPDNPKLAGQFNHVRRCDPVIADDNYAYVTLRTGNTCPGSSNELNILKLNNSGDPTLEKTYEMTNPHGLSKSNHILFICDGKAGVKIYNASNVRDIKLVTILNIADAYDVITLGKVALIVGKDGLYQYSYSDLGSVRLLSKMEVKAQ